MLCFPAHSCGCWQAQFPAGCWMGASLLCHVGLCIGCPSVLTICHPDSSRVSDPRERVNPDKSHGIFYNLILEVVRLPSLTITSVIILSLYRLHWYSIRGDCRRVWIPAGGDHWVPSWKLAATPGIELLPCARHFVPDTLPNVLSLKVRRKWFRVWVPHSGWVMAHSWLSVFSLSPTQAV